MLSENRRQTSVTLLALLCSFSYPLAAQEDPGRDQAESILHEAAVQGGLIVHLGCNHPQLTTALWKGDHFVVQGLDRNADNVESAREYIRSQRLYGLVSVRRWSGGRLPYADNLVNLLVISPGFSVEQEEVQRVLRPGSAAVTLDASLAPEKTFRKPVPSDIDGWTHYLHDAGNNAVAEDDRVGPPQHLQWKSGPMWCRSHEFSSSVQTLVSDEGRLIGIIDEGIIGQPRGVPAFWTLMARDAFNGILLWRRPCDRIHPQALVVVGGSIYVTLQKLGPLSILNAATGETLRTCPETGKVSEIVSCEDRLILSSQLRGKSGRFAPYIVAVDPKNGRVLWKRPAKATAGHSLVAGSGRICYSNQRELVCLALGDGQELWRTEAEGKGRAYVVLYEDTVFLTGGRTRAFSLKTGKLLWTGPDGNPHARNPPGLFGADGLIWTAWDEVERRSFLWQHREETRNGYDPATGEVRRTITAQRLVTAGHHIRCYPPKATRRYLLLNKRGVEFFDLQGSNHMRANWTRGACGFGMLPANGLLYTPPSQCFCYQGVLLTGMNALSATRETPRGATPAADTRGHVQRGLAFGDVDLSRPSSGSTNSDWPTYRHDPFRSGAIDVSLPVNPQRIWETSLCAPAFASAEQGDDERPELRERPKGGLTPPVAANGRLVVAEPDAHAVHAIDTDNGQHLWSYVADGRVDSPPTLYKGLCIFGCTDGQVYCLSVADGRLVWRFQAAPEQRQICVMGQVESAWPVHGSVLVRNDRVYCTAGRSSYLDGGIYLYALEPRTGQILYEYQLKSEEPDVTRYGGRPFDMDGSRSDILVAGPEDLYLFQKRFNAELAPQPMPRITKLGDRRCEPHLMTTDGFLDKTWFNRTYWTYSGRWPGYYFTYRGPKSGQILVFDDMATYALKVYTERRGHSPEFRPGTGYQLIADRNLTQPVLDVMEIGAEKGRGYSRTELPIWSARIPIRVQAMVLARQQLYVAGPPDLASEEGAYEAMIGKRGSVVRVVSTIDGNSLQEFEMDEVPVFDGLIAAGDRLFMATMQGTVICFGEKK